MSRYYYIVFLFITFLTVGCASKQTSIQANSIKILDSNLTSQYSSEDKLLLFALDSYTRGDFKASAKYYSDLYYQTNKVDYATQAIKSAVIAKDYESIKDLLDQVIVRGSDDPALNQYLVAYYIDKKMFKKAKTLTAKLLKEVRNAKNLELSALVYEGLGEYPKALALFEEAYTLEKGEYPLLKMTDLLYIKMDQKEKAMRLLQTHTKLIGCSQTICTRLMQFYAHASDSDGVAKVLKNLYKTTKNPSYAQRLLQLYSSEKKYNKAIAFLKETQFDDLILLDIYTAKKAYRSAMKLSDKLYKERKDPALLARSAILEYESSKNKNSKKMLKRVMQKFEQVVKSLHDPLFYNYYGYLLIDHEIDIDKGIALVQKALKIEPDSHFYIDSLAWGLYKKGNCHDALKLLEPIAKISDEEEIVEHIKKIKQCIEEENK